LRPPLGPQRGRWLAVDQDLHWAGDGLADRSLSSNHAQDEDQGKQAFRFQRHSSNRPNGMEKRPCGVQPASTDVVPTYLELKQGSRIAGHRLRQFERGPRAASLTSFGKETRRPCPYGRGVVWGGGRVFRARNGMTSLAWTPGLPEATTSCALLTQYRPTSHSRNHSFRSRASGSWLRFHLAHAARPPGERWPDSQKTTPACYSNCRSISFLKIKNSAMVAISRGLNGQQRYYEFRNDPLADFERQAIAIWGSYRKSQKSFNWPRRSR
jgi:hypothetical protein